MVIFKAAIGYFRFFCLCLVLFARRNSHPLVMGFLVNRSEDLFLRTLRDQGRILRCNYFRGGPGFHGRAAIWKLVLLRKLLPREASIVVWGYRDLLNLGFSLEDFFPKVTRIEAGLVPGISNGRDMSAFIHSDQGIYFDGRRPSQLEEALNRYPQMPKAIRIEQENTVRSIIAKRVSKFGVSNKTPFEFCRNPVLIVGQVPDDQALTYTQSLCKTNVELVDRVLNDPELTDGASVYYKPHPKNKQNRKELAYLQDKYSRLEIIPEDQGIIDLLEKKPVVATITSGVGLEAALRDCVVHCYGVSFYSNWGFTVDHVPCDRRRASLKAIDVAVEIMINQSTYIDPQTGAVIELTDLYKIE